MVIYPKLFNTSKCKYQEMKADILNSSFIPIFVSLTQMSSVKSKNKGICLAVPVLMEGTAYTALTNLPSHRQFSNRLHLFS